MVRGPTNQPPQPTQNIVNFKKCVSEQRQPPLSRFSANVFNSPSSRGLKKAFRKHQLGQEVDRFWVYPELNQLSRMTLTATSDILASFPRPGRKKTHVATRLGDDQLLNKQYEFAKLLICSALNHAGSEGTAASLGQSLYHDPGDKIIRHSPHSTPKMPDFKHSELV